VLWVISGHQGPTAAMSALSPEADSRQRIEHVCFVPIADIQPSLKPSINDKSLTRVLCARLPFHSELPPGGVPV
jgi:hypothetical protein